MTEYFGQEYQRAQRTWEQILPECSMNTIFITPLWQSVWWKRFKPSGKLIIEVVDDGEFDLGVIPLHINEGMASFIGDSNLYDYMDFPVVAGKEELFFTKALKKISQLDWQTLKLESIFEDSPTLEFISDKSRALGMDVEIKESDKTPLVLLPDTWDEYLLQLRKKDRHELRRKFRRLDANGDSEQIEVNVDSENVDTVMDQFFDLMALSGEDKSIFLDTDNRGFFKDIATSLSDSGQFRLFFLEINGVKVATCICFDYGENFLLYNSGYNPEYSSLSVGLLNKANTISTAIESSKKQYNFLKGTERYKYHLGAQESSVFDVIIKR